MNCPRQCGRKAREHAMFGVLPCLNCTEQDQKNRKSTQAPEFVTQTQQTRIQGQRDRHEADIMPAYTHDGKPSEDFRRAFPIKAKELFSEYDRITNANLD